MEPPSKTRVNVLNQSGRRLRLEPLRLGVSRALERHGRETAVVNVLLTGDDEIRALNQKFRNVDDSTDVLTFPSGELPVEMPSEIPLGDIAISVPFAARQAAARGVSLGQEIAYLGIHGALHLVGFEDERDTDRENMVAEMNAVAVAAGLKPDEDWYSLLHQEPAD